MEREQSLEKLQDKVAQFDAAINKVQETSQILGGETGPRHLNYGLANLSELDLSERVAKVVGIRRNIMTRTIPRLEEDRAKVVSQIETHTESRLLANIEFVRSLLGQGATEREVELAEQALRNYRARTAQAQSAPTTPVEPPVSPPPPEAPKEAGEEKKQIIAPVRYIFDPEAGTFSIVGGKSRTLSSSEHVLVKTLHDHVGIAINSSVVKKALEEAEIKSQPGLVAFELEHHLEQQILTRIRVPGERGTRWMWALGINPPETSLVEAGEVKQPLPEMRINMTTYQVEIDGRLIEVKGEIGRAILTNFEEIAGQRSITASRIRELLKELGIIPGVPGLAIRNLNRTLGSPLITAAGPDQYILNADVTFVSEEVSKPSRSQEQTKREAHLLYTKTLPDGQEIQIRGKIVADCFDVIFRGTKENPVPSDQVDKNILLRLRRILEPLGWTIIQPVSRQEISKGKTGVYYPEKIQVEESVSPAAPQTPDQVVDTEKLQKELDKLRNQKQELMDQGSKLLWAGQDEFLQNALNELEEKITQTEAQIRLLKPLEPEDLEEEELEQEPTAEIPPAGRIGEATDVRFIPYEPSPEEIRTEGENKILEYVIESLSANSRIRFLDIQAKLGPRIGKVPGGKGVFIYQAKELKDMFRTGLRKFREELIIPNLRSKWSENDQSIWDKVEQAITKLSFGDIEDLIRKVVALIDRAEREFYRNSPPPENGGRRVNYIRL